MLQRLVFAGLRFLASRKRNDTLEPSSINTILAVELSRLGDVIVMLPSLTRFQTFFPHASIRVLTDERYVTLLNSLDTGMEFAGIRNAESARGILQALRVVRTTSGDLAVSMSTARRNALVTLWSMSRYKAGYLSYVDSLTPFLLTTPVEAFGFGLSTHSEYGRENIYERPSKICESLGMGAQAARPHLKFKPGVVESVRTLMNEREPMPEGKYVVMHPMAGWTYRSWGISRFIALAGRITGDYGMHVVLSCEGKDAETVRRLLPPDSPIKVMVPGDLLGAAVLMQGASLVVGNDSGPLQLAAGLDVKTIGLFGPAPPELTAPQSDNGVYLYKSVECSPCDQRRCIRPDRPCMSLHEVDEVFACVAGRLGSPVTGETVTTHA